MSENAGLYQKFNVSRRDGRDLPGGDRSNAAYFVLDVANDPYALPALKAYADSCRATLPLLADQLDLVIAGHLPAIQQLRIPR